MTLFSKERESPSTKMDPSKFLYHSRSKSWLNLAFTIRLSQTPNSTSGKLYLWGETEPFLLTQKEMEEVKVKLGILED